MNVDKVFVRLTQFSEGFSYALGLVGLVLALDNPLDLNLHSDSNVSPYIETVAGAGMVVLSVVAGLLFRKARHS